MTINQLQFIKSHLSPEAPHHIITEIDSAIAELREAQVTKAKNILEFEENYRTDADTFMLYFPASITVEIFSCEEDAESDMRSCHDQKVPYTIIDEEELETLAQQQLIDQVIDSTEQTFLELEGSDFDDRHEIIATVEIGFKTFIQAQSHKNAQQLLTEMFNNQDLTLPPIHTTLHREITIQ